MPGYGQQAKTGHRAQSIADQPSVQGFQGIRPEALFLFSVILYKTTLLVRRAINTATSHDSRTCPQRKASVGLMKRAGR